MEYHIEKNNKDLSDEELDSKNRKQKKQTKKKNVSHILLCYKVFESFLTFRKQKILRIRKTKKQKKLNKLLEDEEQKEFFMKGLPYKDKYLGQRLSKMDYENKYASISEKIKLNFPGMSIDAEGKLVPTNKFLRQKREQGNNRLEKQYELQALFNKNKSILKQSDHESSK